MRDITYHLRIAGCLTALLASVAAAACGTSATDSASPNTAATAAPTKPGELTPFQIEHGIGPVTEPVALGAIDQSLAKAGSTVFEQKCASCHKIDERYVGPPLGEVLERRTPTFVLNMVLNPQTMVEKHPVPKKLLAEFLVMMPNQNVTPDEARQVLEYLRTQQKKK
jgi:mono/diheme cytochrome c family protein